MLRETHLAPNHLVLPLFVQAGQNLENAISSLRGQAPLSLDRRLDVAVLQREVRELKMPLPGLKNELKKQLKKQLRELCVIIDVALDPYSSDGHAGVSSDTRIDNDTMLPLPPAAMAIAQARAGAEIVAPSGMMDGRVAAIRDALDEAGFTDVAILSCCVKDAPAYRGPFREALGSEPVAATR